MIEVFDKLGQTLNDMIGNHQNNTVEHAVKNIYGYASGGEVSELSPRFNASEGAGDPFEQAIKGLPSALSKNPSSAFDSNANPALGSRVSAYNSPIFFTPHLTNAYGRFFSGADVGSTNRPAQQPQKSKPIQSEDPQTFYSKWFSRMRDFAESEDIANKGAPQIRTK